jgi:hypothetical protein
MPLPAQPWRSCSFRAERTNSSATEQQRHARRIQERYAMSAQYRHLFDVQRISGVQIEEKLNIL